MPGWLKSRKTVFRVILFVILLGLIATVLFVLFETPLGARVRANRHEFHEEFRQWVWTHRFVAPVVFILLYVVVSCCLLPVWWLGALAGFGFGLGFGILWTLVGATLGACGCYLISRTLLADYFHQKFEARHAKLRELDEKMGHNGLLVVMAARLMHFLPFGASNYLFGITRITLMEVGVGTFLGTIPAVALWTAGGAGIKPHQNWWFMGVIAFLNVALLVPILLRYLKPEWFKKIGVE